MYKRNVGHIHVAHPEPKRKKIHQLYDADITDIATAIMFDICAFIYKNIPTEYRLWSYGKWQVYDGIKQYIDGVKNELGYDDIPFDDLTTNEFEQAGTNIIREAERGGMLESGAIFYSVARQAIILIKKGREADARRRRYGLDLPSYSMADNTLRVMTNIQERSHTKQRKPLSEQEIWDRVGVTSARPTESELDYFIADACYSEYIAFFRKFWCNDIDLLTPDIARSLIGKTIYVISHEKQNGFDINRGDFDVLGRKMTIVEPMRIINQVSPSTFQIQFRSRNEMISSEFLDEALQFGDVPLFIFIHGLHTSASYASSRAMTLGPR